MRTTPEGVMLLHRCVCSSFMSAFGSRLWEFSVHMTGLARLQWLVPQNLNVLSPRDSKDPVFYVRRSMQGPDMKTMDTAMSLSGVGSGLLLPDISSQMVEVGMSRAMSLRTESGWRHINGLAWYFRH